MKFDKLTTSIYEAERFLMKARALYASEMVWRKGAKKDGPYVAEGPKAAAAKRASMDLTRALAEMRKP